MRIRTSNICINILSDMCMSITSNILKINTTFPSPQGACPLGERKNNLFMFYILDVTLMHVPHGIFMHMLNVLIHMLILDVLLLLQQPAGAWRRRISTHDRSQKPQRWHQMSLMCITRYAVYFKWWILTPALRQKLRIGQYETQDFDHAYPMGSGQQNPNVRPLFCLGPTS